MIAIALDPPSPYTQEMYTPREAVHQPRHRIRGGAEDSKQEARRRRRRRAGIALLVFSVACCRLVDVSIFMVIITRVAGEMGAYNLAQLVGGSIFSTAAAIAVICGQRWAFLPLKLLTFIALVMNITFFATHGMMVRDNIAQASLSLPLWAASVGVYAAMFGVTFTRPVRSLASRRDMRL